MVVGAAGPMGQMHIERALGMTEGPRLVIGIDLDASRLDDRARQARDRGRPSAAATLVLSALGTEPDALATAISEPDGWSRSRRHHRDRDRARPRCADGLVGTGARRDAGSVRRCPGRARASPGHVARCISTGPSTRGRPARGSPTRRSWSRRRSRGSWRPARALGAVGGMEAAGKACEALVEGRFAGKIVIYPAPRGTAVDLGRATSASARPGRSEQRLDPGGVVDHRRRRPRCSPATWRPPRGPLIVTVTPNPSIDRTLRIPPLERGAGRSAPRRRPPSLAARGSTSHGR